jgi:hypothetical protein
MSKTEKVKLPNGTVVEVSDYEPEKGDELFYTSDGKPITNELAEQWQRDIEEDDTLFDRPSKTTYPRRGRPSLTSPGVESPQIRFRVSSDTKSKADIVAEQEGKTVSQIARELFENYLRHKAA